MRPSCTVHRPDNNLPRTSTAPPSSIWPRRPQLHVKRCGKVGNENSPMNLPGNRTTQPARPADEGRRPHPAIPVPRHSPFRRYPHFYPQARTINLDNEGPKSVHNRHGDIFVNNSRQFGYPAPLIDRNRVRTPWKYVKSALLNTGETHAFPYENAN